MATKHDIFRCRLCATYNVRPVAIVGRATENGDTIISSLQSSVQIHGIADNDGIAGLLQQGFVPPIGDDA
jgi:hypothetical protein